MPNSNGLITRPVNQSDVQVVLGISSSIGAWSQLCTNANINKWAKYKPVGFNSKAIMDQYDFTAERWKDDSTWWKGTISREVIPAGTTFLHVTNDYPAAWIKICGIKYLGFTSKSDVVKIFNPAGNHWVRQMGGIFASNFSHVPPQGTDSEPYRIVDFIRYLHSAQFSAFTDYETEGTVYVNINDDGAKHQVCSLIDYAEGNSLNFNNIFSGINNDAYFDVIVAKLVSSTMTLMSPTTVRSTSGGRKDVTVYMETLEANNSYVGIYCAIITVSGTTYYVPLMQSAGDTPNFTFPVSPKARAFKFWRLGSSVQNNMSAFFKDNYAGTYRQFVTNTGGTMGNGEMLYFKMDIVNSTHSSITVSKGSIKVELAGRFNEASGGSREVYYQYADGDGSTSHQVRFALRDDEQSKASWDDEGSFIIPPVGSGQNTKTLYLAMYNIFNDGSDYTVTRGGTVYRASIWLNKNSEMPSAVFGDMTENGKLNISVSAL